MQTFVCAVVLTFLWPYAGAQAQDTEPNLTLQVPAEMAVRSEVPPRSYDEDLRIHRLRAGGWMLFALGSSAVATGILLRLDPPSSSSSSSSPEIDDFVLDFEEFNQFFSRISWSLLIPGAAIGITGAAMLIAARVRVNRRGRRERDARARYFQPTVDLGLSPGGLLVNVGF